MLLFVSLDCEQWCSFWCVNVGTMMLVMRGNRHSKIFMTLGVL